MPSFFRGRSGSQGSGSGSDYGSGRGRGYSRGGPSIRRATLAGVGPVGSPPAVATTPEEWELKLANDRKTGRHDVIKTFHRLSIFLKKHWIHGLIPIGRFVTQDAFDTAKRILAHLIATADANHGQEVADNDECLDTLRARAGSL